MHQDRPRRRRVTPGWLGVALGVALLFTGAWTVLQPSGGRVAAGIVPAATRSATPAAGGTAVTPTAVPPADAAVGAADGPPDETPTTTPAPGPTPPSSAPLTSPAPSAATGPGQPQRLRLPALGIDAPVTAVGVSAAGDLGVPDDVNVLGWWRGGAAPGAGVGTVVIDGHVDSATQGLGTFARLRDAPVGAVVSVLTDKGSVTYTVTGRRAYGKDALPADVFAAGGSPRLVLITCGGTFDRATGHYRDNVVVYAVPS